MIPCRNIVDAEITRARHEPCRIYEEGYEWAFDGFSLQKSSRAPSAKKAGVRYSGMEIALPSDRTEGNLQSVFFPGGLPTGYSHLDHSALAFLYLPASKCPGFNDGQFCIPSLPGIPGLNSSNKVNELRFGFNRFTFQQIPTEPVTLDCDGRG